MAQKPDRDIEKDYPLPDFIDKLRRLANALEDGQRFEIQIAGERVSVPVRATYNIEHERGDGKEEIEFQIKWSSKSLTAGPSSQWCKDQLSTTACYDLSRSHAAARARTPMKLEAVFS